VYSPGHWDRTTCDTQHPAPSCTVGVFCVRRVRRYILKIIDLCAVLCYNSYWLANKNASWFVVATNIGRGSENALEVDIVGS
jgi:hypothetical protein